MAVCECECTCEQDQQAYEIEAMVGAIYAMSWPAPDYLMHLMLEEQDARRWAPDVRPDDLYEIDRCTQGGA